MKTFAKFLVLALIVGLVFYGLDAFAQSSDHKNVFSYAADILMKTFKNVRMVVYVLGAFGLIGIAVGGILGMLIATPLCSLIYTLFGKEVNDRLKKNKIAIKVDKKEKA